MTFQPREWCVPATAAGPDEKYSTAPSVRAVLPGKVAVDATFRIDLDRDDDGNYEELIADAAPADSASRGHFAWTVTAPPSANARVRVAWTDDLSVSDASDVTFQIRPN